MPDVSIKIAERRFTVTCGEGEEQHLLRLGNMVDETARKTGYNGQGFTESRLLLFTALLLADQLDDMQKKVSVPENDTSRGDAKDAEMAARTLARLSDRMEKLASALEEMVEPS